MRRKRLAQRGYGIFSGEVVDAAVAFSFAEHRKDRRGRDFGRFDELHQTGNVAGTLGRYTQYVYREHAHSPSPLDQKINRRSVQPMA